ncbi:MAG: hypothetical protein AAFY88_17895, partial [Acidobacteriota bacterium]
SRGTYRSLARQYFQYGVYKVRVLQKHPLQMRPRQFVPAAFMLGLLAAAAAWPWLGPLPLLLLLGAYAVANLGAAALVARAGSTGRGARHLLGLGAGRGARHLLGLFLRLPPAFALLHFGYGLGFLVGLVRFAGRWGDGDGRVPSLGWGSP